MNSSAYDLGVNLGHVSQIDFVVDAISKRLNYEPDKLSEDMNYSFKFVTNPNDCGSTEIAHAHHLNKELKKYCQDITSTQVLAMFIGYKRGCQLKEGIEEMEKEIASRIKNDR